MKTSVVPSVDSTAASELSPPLPAILGWLLRLCSHERSDAVIGAMPGAPVLYRLK
ncbi:hypothetical protein [Pseudomonas sp. EpS/L25]|uniref:hypothetical protein n=1 Tax=Pseudomonas sp. EpS/L25 TaxID=1749078 RepID=UPI000A5539EF|nr:hypothetical protein [Pseudomonas sp. EpS/L25]